MRLLILTLFAFTIHAADIVTAEDSARILEQIQARKIKNPDPTVPADTAKQIEDKAAALEKQAKELQEKAAIIRREFYYAWLESADLTPITNTVLPSDPKVSEIERHKAIESLNLYLKHLAGNRESNHNESRGNPNKNVAVEPVQSFMASKEYALYLETRKH